MQNSSRNFSTEIRPSYFHYIGKEKLLYKTLGQQLDETAQKHPNTEAIVSYHEGKRYTFASVKDIVDKLAANFLKLGLDKGDRVGIYAPNNMHWYLTMMGAGKAGLVSVGINPAFQAPELEYCLKKVGVKALVCAESYRNQQYYEILEKVCPELKDSIEGHLKSKNVPDLKAVIIDSQDKWAGTLKFDDLLDCSDKNALQKLSDMQSTIKPDSACNIQFTSGTTGHPKAAVLTHFNVINNAYFNGKRNEMMENHRILVQNPLFHAYGVAICTTPALCHAATMILPSDGFSPEASLRAIVDEEVTMIHGTPTMYVDLIKKQQELQLPIKTAEIAVTGGAQCSPYLLKEIKDVLKLKKVKSVFGMTELTAVCFQSMTDDDEDKILNTVGHLQDHLEAKVVDLNGDTVPFGQPGELCVRGYSVMLHYLNDEAKTKETISACRWLNTGDKFILYENGYGQIVGRLKEMIIRGGENIFPKEIEDFLGTHPNILEIHVIGVDDKRLGEEVCAYVRLHDDTKTITREDLKTFCKGKLSYFKIPKYIRVVKDFPRTTSGKIQKFKLKEAFESEK
ncbi:medium-chain acyl-CoA ligase ACSF2, mitochondrial isoform X2 [Episyrphus balteatus]|uniref:medium-chain acyl-CoA ligase ACSF2, mitochondrial isoform X2 n=1 Tax=Episyrphus balteatus TaxID=286459 RepID=UPI002485730B|nr:medium-chain acyl-CoA ligase ACSF2, mitochondrial isoform X2 [Episyrphus balteatus]